MMSTCTLSYVQMAMSTYKFLACKCLQLSVRKHINLPAVV